MNVTIVDYGMGNIFSVSRAFERCGATVRLGSKPEEILETSLLVLPGVGAFGQGMQELQQRGLVEPLRFYAREGRGSLLGICLGMQMLFEASDEAPGVSGLGLFKGSVVKIPTARPDARVAKVPHIGWSELHWNDGTRQQSVLKTLHQPKAEAYFVHSYMAAPKDPASVVAWANDEGLDLPAIVAGPNVVGMQFHPEKSGPVGLAMITQFLANKERANVPHQ